MTTDGELLETIDLYADKHPNFDNSFCESLKEFIDQYDELTDAQRDACENIIKKFRMK